MMAAVKTTKNKFILLVRVTRAATGCVGTRPGGQAPP
jgi:hypothetical protein